MLQFALSKVAGKKRFQAFFEKLYRTSVQGMNYGRGYDIYRDGEIDAIKYVAGKLKDRKPVVFDVGANKGSYTKELAAYFKNADIYCFEPSKATFSMLESNVGDIPGVKCCNFGFGKENSEVELYSDAEGSGIASLYDRRLGHLGIAMQIKETISIRRIDDFCKSQGIAQIDFLKLDIEGHELAALAGAGELLEQKKIRFIQFEFGGCNIDSRTYFQDFWYLLSPTYMIYRIVADGLYPIKRYSETYEIFRTVNYLAELKN
ncbi:MAG TPA: FkbM family methyltransferase [Cyclobacteriaceae bacterium]